MHEPYLVAVGFRKHFGTDALRGEEKWMDDLVDVCMGNFKS